MIEFDRVTRDFGPTRAVDELSLRITEGELYGCLGPNGAGKTTSLRMAVGLLRPTSGTLRIAGRDVLTEAPAVRRLRGFVPDTPPIYDHLTGWQYVAFVASLWNVDRAQRDADAERMFTLLDLQEARNQICQGYSFGMKKKLHLAAILVTRPRVLFLDEPTAGLDPRSTRTLKDLLRELCAGGTTIFLTTHLLDAAEELCDRIGIVAKGRLLAEGTMSELRARTGDARLEQVFLSLTEP
ncbi:MAG: ABC transporter ATP-binding protein [Planctomycetes bacterium]|nr:ABC transporter ATP-binding protein [Planctomycetota bacterium]